MTTTEIPNEGQEAPAPEATEDKPKEAQFAGKFSSTEELEAAYKALEARLGMKDQPSETTKDEAKPEEPKAGEEDPSPFVVEEKTDEQRAYEKETYGDALAGVFETAKLDAKAVGDHYLETGEFPPEAYDALEGAGYSRAVVDSYLAGAVGKASDAQADAAFFETDVKETIGGSEEYTRMIEWAGTALSAEEVARFNAAVSTDNRDAAMFAVQALHDRFTRERGSAEPKVYGGKGRAPAGDRFNSVAELVEAQKDSRYKTDRAYQQSVADKLSRSSIFKRG